MIDRLEVFTSLRPTMWLLKRLAGHTATKSESARLRTELMHLDRIAYNSKLVREDEEIRALKNIDTNALYRNVLVETIVADAKEREQYDDPIQFVLMANPRFKKQQRDRFKVVCNPSTVSVGRLKDFLRRCFKPTRGEEADAFFFSRYRLGRVDFCVDIETHGVSDLDGILLVDRRIVLHTRLHDAPGEEESGFIRTVGRGEPETIYIGKTPVCIRIYNKVKEAKHQIQVCKAQGWKVSERVQNYAEKKLLTRIEIQIRDLARLGVDIGTGEVSSKYGFLNLQSLYELMTMRPVSCDMFSMLRFAQEQRVAGNVFGSPWQEKAFNELVRKDGLSQAVLQLPQYKRKEVKQAVSTRDFPHDLNKMCYSEISKWLRSAA